MPDQSDDTKLPPPSGDSQRAQGYVDQLIPLISEDKLKVSHTDLSRFDPSSLHDHYSLDLTDYQIEISHSKQPTTGRDSYVILFNNLKNLTEDQTQKEILAYLIISEEQFKKLKDVADEQVETLKKIEEEKRFKVAMSPVDALLAKIGSGEVDRSKPPPKIPEIKTTKSAAEEPEAAPPKDIPTPLEDTSPPISKDTEDVLSGVEERPQEQAPIEDLPADVPTQQPVSALAAAAAAPLPHVVSDAESNSPHEATQAEPPLEAPAAPIEAAPAPIVEEVEQPAPIQVPSQPPPPPAKPNPTIEEVQRALKQAYEQSPQAQPPPEYRPAAVTSEPADTAINTIPVEAQTPPDPHIDQAINEAFSPANNFKLTHESKTPDV